MSGGGKFSLKNRPGSGTILAYDLTEDSENRVGAGSGG
jgi:hypothetical protein